VAVGINQTVLTSPDGETWTRRTFPGGNGLTGVIHDGTRFVASGYRFSNANQKGLAALSEDGIRWTTVNVDAGTVQFWGVAHGAGRLVMVGDAGAIYTSTDGAAWSPTSSGVTSVLRSVVHADGLFVATGDAGRVLVSSDGVNWTNRSLPVTSNFTGVARHRGQWIVRAFTTVYASADGLSWSRVWPPTACVPSRVCCSPASPAPASNSPRRPHLGRRCHRKPRAKRCARSPPAAGAWSRSAATD